ncbi:MAG: S8 family serine peptidase [Anaerolineales bacterium]|nr:S8 family serine peptidase [Anaerolineales bacterium]
MTEAPQPNYAEASPQNKSGAPLMLFILFALPLPLCLFLYNFVVWYLGQMAIASLSLGVLQWSGLIGLALQAFLISLSIGLLWYFTKDERFKPIYAGWFGASLFAFPALSLRLLGPNNDQVGAILQFLLCVISAGVALRFRKNKIEWKRGSLPFGLLIAGIGVLPFALYGSFGSFADACLSLLAGLGLGLLAAVLMENTTGSLLLDGLGIGALLALLGSAIGYDGSELILIAILPAFAFAIAAILPSRLGAGSAVALLAFAGLAMFDPTELTIVLGDIAAVATKTGWAVIGIGLAVNVVALILHFVARPASGPRTKRAVGWAGAGVVWVAVSAVFFILGHPGNYGDRLFVIFKEQADLSQVAKIQNREERLSAAYQQLTQLANASQNDLRNLFDKTGVQYTPYYLENALEVQGGTLLRLYLLTRPEVDRVIPSPRLRAVPPADATPIQPQDSDPIPSGVGWNISMIGADKVWDEFGAQGAGIVIGNSDSGVDGKHPAIQKQYRGYNNGDDYNWYDPWEGSASPVDHHGHGTHTTGTILGADGIGVAPKAQWIACVNLDRNLGNPAFYLDCLQFMFAPFPQDGNPFTDGEPAKAADILNNSWGCPEIEGCDPNALLPAANNLRDAGIFVVVSTGNDGPLCGTVQSPLSLYDSVFSVGAIDQNGDVADFSSRGPVTVDGSDRIKPDIVAPGVDILSALPNDAYGANSGTSMAGPHLVGVVALIWSAQPELIGNIDATEQLIIDTAQPYTGDRSIGCFTGGMPSNAFGYGVVNVYEAVKQALGK